MPRFLGLNLNSLTFRLSFLFAMTTIILLAGAGIFLYRFLEQELMQRDHEELISKVDLFRHQLSTFEKPGMIVTSPNLFRELIAGHPNFRLTLLDEHKKTLLTTSEWELPQELLNNPVNIENIPDHDTIVMPTLDQPYHAVAAWGSTNNSQDGKVLIVLALEVDQAQTLLLRYRKTLLITLFFSVFTAASLGFIIAQRGLRPLHTMAETASAISANHLQKRLSVAHTPAELKELAGAFNGMLGRLHQSFVQLSDFSSDIAHELRTPINNLMGQTQVALSRTREASEYKAVLESNLEEYERLARMIKDMLFLAQADNSQSDTTLSDHSHSPLHEEPLDLRAELDKVVEFFQMIADEKALKIIPVGIGTITADRILVQRAIGNLMSNAVQHSDPNSEIYATISSTGQGAEVQVSNRGAGIPAEDLKRVFDRFYRLDNSRIRTDTGTGLGLAIVKSIMKLHGGRVTVESQLNRLTTFTLHFPK